MQLNIDITPDTIYLLRSIERFQILADRSGISDVATDLLFSITATIAQDLESCYDPITRSALIGLVDSLNVDLDGTELIARLADR